MRSVLACPVIAALALLAPIPHVAASDSNMCFKKLVIAIDIGHTRANPGAKDVFGRAELEYNYDLALITIEQLRKSGIGGTFLINEKLDLAPLPDRPRMAHRLGADLFISIHHDNVDEQLKQSAEVDGRLIKFNDLVEGYSVYFSSRNPDSSLSKLLAVSIAEGLLQTGVISAKPYQDIIIDDLRKPANDRLNVIEFPTLQVLATAPIPAVLLEAGFLSNRKDIQRLTNSEYQIQIANGIIDGLKAACSKEPNLAGLNASTRKSTSDKRHPR